MLAACVATKMKGYTGFYGLVIFFLFLTNIRCVGYETKGSSHSSNLRPCNDSERWKYPFLLLLPILHFHHNVFSLAMIIDVIYKGAD